MKKILLILAFIPFWGFGQNCYYSQNDVDKFTGHQIKTTKAVKVSLDFFTESAFVFSKQDTSYFLFAGFNMSKYTYFEPHTIKTGDELLLLLSDGKVIKLKAGADFVPKKGSIPGIPITYYSSLENIWYEINSKDFKQLVSSEISSIRFNYQGNGVTPTSSDWNLNSAKDREKLRNAAKCLF